MLKAETTRAFGTLFASASAPEEVWAITRSVLSAFIGSEQLTMTLPDTSPACFNTSSTRDQCTASKSASASRAASPGVPARAFPCAGKDQPWPREIFGQQLGGAERQAGVPRLEGGRWHAYRRKWATERGDVPLKALMVAGGWKDMQTLLTCYQQPTDDALLDVMAHPTKLRERKTG